MNTIVFGGTGWVGHNIVRAFVAADHDVAVCSRGTKTTYLDGVPSGVRMVRGDKNVEADVVRVLAESYDVIIDSVPTNTSVALIAKHARELKHYVHCSSTGGYAPLPFVPGDETMPYDHFMGGWAQKAVVDQAALGLHARQGFPATVLRPCYITGPGLLPLDNLGGRREDFIADILAGNTLDLPGDGQALLQPVHVHDLATAFLLTVEHPRSIGHIYNICQDKAVTITRYLQINVFSYMRMPRHAPGKISTLGQLIAVW